MIARRRGAAAALLLAACSAPADDPVRVFDGPALREFVHSQVGKPVLLNFWATWCVPCVEELPDLKAATRDFRARGGMVIGVAMECVVKGVTPETGMGKVQDLRRRLGLDFPLVVCSETDLLDLRAQLGVDLGELPSTLVLDRAGAHVELHEGKSDRVRFVALAKEAER